MFLSDADIARLTGRKRKSAQIRQLAKQGVEYRVDADGKPLVLISDVNARLGVVISEPEQQAETPQEWFERCFEDHIYSPEYIIENSVGHSADISNKGRTYSGLYFLINSNEIVYVGLSKSVCDRTNRHFWNQRYGHDGAMEFDRMYAIRLNELFIDKVEAIYINLFKPKYNVKYLGADSELMKRAKKKLSWK